MQIVSQKYGHIWVISRPRLICHQDWLATLCRHQKNSTVDSQTITFIWKLKLEIMIIWGVAGHVGDIIRSLKGISSCFIPIKIIINLPLLIRSSNNHTILISSLNPSKPINSKTKLLVMTYYSISISLRFICSSDNYDLIIRCTNISPLFWTTLELVITVWLRFSEVYIRFICWYRQNTVLR